jgi:hypothetical protein
MLSGIQDHLAGPDRIERVRELQDLDQAVLTVPCRRIDSVLAERGVRIVDYLSVDVEGAEWQVLEGVDFARIRVNVVGVESSPSFPEVYRLLTAAGFEYQGLLFFDEIFVHRERRFTWER